jgi:phosphoglucosamine mutase
MSNFGLGRALKQLEIKYEASRIGDRQVLELMRKRGAVIGGEDSGHMIFLNHHTTGDGIISALQLLFALQLYNQPLSQLAQLMHPSPQKLVNLEVKEKPPLEKIPGLSEAVRAAEEEMGERGRVLIRYSGTQKICRVMAEGPTWKITERICETLAAILRKSIG